MKIKQFRYSADNLGYVIYGQTEAVAIDGGAVETILSFVGTEGLSLKYVTNTHGHGDHTAGTLDLVEASGAAFLDYRSLPGQKEIRLEGSSIAVYPTPGHTENSITFHFDDVIVTGDTLFNGTVGNPFSGDLKVFYHSIQKLMALPDETIVYAGHDYVKESMAVAKRIEPDNGDVERFLETYTPDHVRSRIQDERRINPYVRFNEPTVIAFLKQQGLPVETEYERWESIMAVD